MELMNPVSRRTFMQGLAAALSYSKIPASELLSYTQQQPPQPQPAADDVEKTVEEEYDELAKLANNENPYGPSQAVLKAMEGAFKYANRYGYPDGGIVGEIADFHQVSTENILLGAGSGEILKVCDDAFLAHHRLIVGPDPTYESVYVYATNSKADAIKVPLTDDHRTDIPGMIRAVKNNIPLSQDRDIGVRASRHREVCRFSVHALMNNQSIARLKFRDRELHGGPRRRFRSVGSIGSGFADVVNVTGHRAGFHRRILICHRG